MQKLELQWKAFNVDLEAVEAKMKNDFPETYKGNQAFNGLELWFSELPSEEEQEAIQQWWEGLSEESDEAASYRSVEDVQACIKSLKEGIPAKTWNQLTIPERKLVLGITPTKAELIAAELL